MCSVHNEQHALTEAKGNHILKINGGCAIVFSKHCYQQAWSNALGLSYSDVISFRQHVIIREHGAMLLALNSARLRGRDLETNKPPIKHFQC
jgi:hypothetical protein